jgi:hypothetical protein
LGSGDAQASDDLAIADYSASETKRITLKGVVQRGVTLIDDGVIPGAKLVTASVTATQIAPNAITASELAGDAVDTAAVQDAAITNVKLASGIDGGKLVTDSVTATQIAPNAITASELADNAVDTAAIQSAAVTDAKVASGIDGAKLTDGTVTNAKLASGIDGAKLSADSVTATQIAPNAIAASELAGNAVDTTAVQDSAITDAKLASGINGAKLTDATVAAAKITADSVDRGLDKTTGKFGHTNSITAGTSAGISFDAHGHVTGTSSLVSSDLPVATATAIGGVSIPASSGLSVSGTGALTHGTSITAGTTSGITYNATGHITAIAPLAAADVPTATSTTKGAVSVPGPSLAVSAAGAITHTDSGVGAGTYTKVTVDGKGHVTVGAPLAAGDIPNLDASKIVSGSFDATRIADRSLAAIKFANYATVLIQEGEPSGTDFYTGQFWYKESDAQLRTWSGNSWIPVGFGRLSEENLRFCGTFDASTSTVVQVTTLGSSAGFTAGSLIPAATDALTGAYLVCAVPGTYENVTYDNGDWLLCLGQAEGYTRIDTLNGGGGGGATLNLGDLLDVTITAPASGDSLIFDASTNTWKNRTTHGVKLSLVEAFDGTRTSFTTSGTIISQNNLLVSLGGIIQEPGIDFTATDGSTTLSFTTPPPAGSAYWILQEASIDGSGGGGGTTLPPGTAAEEYLQWNSATSSWLPSTILDGGSY